MSLGPRGKLAVSVGAVLTALWFLRYGNSPGSALIIFAVLPLFLRDVWRRRRIR